MEMELWQEIVIGVLSFVLGCAGAMLVNYISNVGTLRIDRSDPDETPYFFLEITNVKRIKHGRTITMTVREENYISQE